jgi:trans-2,3-dihydro-3-hydroxyanthranilate isomerase
VPLSYVIVDVFTDTPLEGNALAVFEDGSQLEDGQMQRLARETNLSETVFLLPPEHGGDARARIFTPVAELPFAGHPVLGTAFVVGGERVVLETAAMTVTVELDLDGGRPVFGRFRQPLPPWQTFDRPQELLGALGVESSGLPVEQYANGPVHVYVELPDADAVRALAPDLGALGRLGTFGFNCFASDGGSWKVRMFGPGLGVAEDPATGSAAGPLALHLSRHGRIAFGDRIEIHQGAEIRRPSVLHATAFGSAAAPVGVEVGGAAVVVARGQFL